MYLVRNTLPKVCLNFLRRTLFPVSIFVFPTLLERWQIQTSCALTFYKSAFSQLSVIFVFFYDTKQILGRRTSTVVVKHMRIVFAKCPLTRNSINPLNPELNPICYLLALLGAHHFLHVSRIRVKLLTFRRPMSYTYGAPILDVSRSHTTMQHSR